MKQAKLTELRRNLSTMLNAVNNDHEPLIVTRRRGKPVVMISLEDFEAMSRPATQVMASRDSARLLSSLTEVDEITFVANTPEEPDKHGQKY